MQLVCSIIKGKLFLWDKETACIVWLIPASLPLLQQKFSLSSLLHPQTCTCFSYKSCFIPFSTALTHYKFSEHFWELPCQLYMLFWSPWRLHTFSTLTYVFLYYHFECKYQIHITFSFLNLPSSSRTFISATHINLSQTLPYTSAGTLSKLIPL